MFKVSSGKEPERENERRGKKARERREKEDE